MKIEKRSELTYVFIKWLKPFVSGVIASLCCLLLENQPVQLFKFVALEHNCSSNSDGHIGEVEAKNIKVQKWCIIYSDSNIFKTHFPEFLLTDITSVSKHFTMSFNHVSFARFLL